MIKSKLLTDAAWKDVLAKNKGVKDNGLTKVLADFKKLDEDDHDGWQKSLDEMLKLAGQLKKSKEIAAVAPVSKYLTELAGVAESAVREVAKAKAEAEKKEKVEAEAAKKREQEERKGAKDEDEDEDEAAEALLTTKMIPLLRMVNKGEVLHTMVASTGKQVVVLLSRKPIAHTRRKLLAEELGSAGGIKYFEGHCLREKGMTTFVLKTQVTGLAKKIKLALLEQTGLRVKLCCRGEDGDIDDDLDEPEEVQDDERGDEGDKRGKGDDRPPEARADGDGKAASPELAQAPEVWDGTRELIGTSIDSLKSAVQAQIADESDEVVTQVNDQLQKLDRILGRLDQRLTSSLAAAGQAREGAGRSDALRESKAILADYIRYVSSEPLIDHLDNNPFGVKTAIKATLSASLTKLARALG